MKTKIKTAVEAVLASQARRQKDWEKEQQALFKMAAAESKISDREKEKRFAKANGIDLTKLNMKGEKARHEAWTAKLEKEYAKAHHHHPKPPFPILTNYPFPRPNPDSDLPIKQDACFFPALECTGTGCQVEQAALHPSMISGYLGGDLGIFAYPAQAAQTHSLTYAFIPPAGGTVNVLAEVLLNGFIEAHSDLGNSTLNWLYQHANADAKLVLSLTAQQGPTILQRYQQTIASIHADPGQARKIEFHHDFQLLTLNTVSVSADVPVIIQVIAEAYAEGQSGFGHANIDFSRANGNSIEVPQLCYLFTETVYGRN